MSKLIMFNMLTLDGYFEGCHKEIWYQVDDEYNQYYLSQLNAAGGLVLGRITYQLLSSYWPTPFAHKNEPAIADRMNSIPKYVFSKTLDHVDWNQAQLINGSAPVEIEKLKSQAEKDLLIMGSADLGATFTTRSLIDEYRLMVNPVVLGDGMPLFKGGNGVVKLQLLGTKSFRNGNVLLTYVPCNGANSS